MNLITIPAGYRQDALGRLVPESTIREIDLTRDRLVQDLAARARKQSDALRAFKNWVLDEITAFVQLSAERFGVQWGGKKGNITLLSYDARFKVVVAVAERIQFDERILVAKDLIDNCIRSWSEGSRPEILALINDAFQVDQQGKISTSRVLSLRGLKIEDEDWKAAMDAISESIMPVGSKTFLRVYERQGNGEYRPISLDVAGV